MMARHLENSCAQGVVDPHRAAPAKYEMVMLKRREESLGANQGKGMRAANAGTEDVAD